MSVNCSFCDSLHTTTSGPFRAVPTDHDDHDQRAARINVMLEELRLNTEDLHELAKQAIDRSWETAQAVQRESPKNREP